MLWTLADGDQTATKATSAVTAEIRRMGSTTAAVTMSHPQGYSETVMGDAIPSIGAVASRIGGRLGWSVPPKARGYAAIMNPRIALVVPRRRHDHDLSTTTKITMLRLLGGR